MKAGSLFSGIGGFDLGFELAGIETVWQVEKEAFCRAVLATHFPNAKRFNDVRECGRHNLAAVDVLTAGFPCQDLSVAGKRRGLEGARSGLFWEVVRILGELRPAWFVLENVPGLFSSNEGRDFAVVLNALDELGYGLAWRVLNSQFFGVAQRRRRVFIVGCLGKPCPEAVLFEPQSGEWDPAQSVEPWPDLAVPLTSGIGITGNPPGRRREDDFNLALSLSSTNAAEQSYRGDASDNLILGRGADQRHPRLFGAGEAPDDAGERSVRGGTDIVNFLAPVRGGADDNDAQAGHIIIQDASRQHNKQQNGIGIQSGGPSYTLDGTSQHAVAYPLTASYGKQLDSSDTNNGPPNAIISPAPHAHGVREFTSLPPGMDSARYRALGNAVTVSTVRWIAERIVSFSREDGGNGRS